MKLEKDLKVIFSRQKFSPGSCPSLETLGSFLEGGLSPEREAETRRHLSRCAFCRERVEIFLASEDFSSQRISPRLLSKAKSVFKPSWGRRFLTRLRELFSGPSLAGESLFFQPVRSSAGDERGKVFSYQERIYPFQIRTEVICLESGRFQLWVEAYNPQAGEPPDGVRVNLKEGEKELESLVLEQGRAVFEPVSRGNYLLEFWERRDFLGGIEILIKERENEQTG